MSRESFRNILISDEAKKYKIIVKAIDNIPIKQIADGMFSNDGLFLIINHHFH